MNKPYRIVVPEAGRVELEAFEPANPGPGKVLVESTYTAVSPGTELAWLHHRANTPGRYPYHPGYSGVGRVVLVGEGVESLREGDRVAARMPHASHAVLAAADCHPLPPTLDEREASPFRLASIAVQGVRKAAIQIGEEVAVVGLGPIGLLAAQWARVAGAQRVTGVDLLPARLELAASCGLDPLWASLEEADGAAGPPFDVVIEATGVPTVITTALARVCDGGRLVLLGSPRGTADSVDFYRDVHRRGVTLIGAHERLRAHTATDERQAYRTHHSDEAAALAYAAAGRLRLAPLISDTRPPSDAPAVYEQLAAPESGLMCVAFDWNA